MAKFEFVNVDLAVAGDPMRVDFTWTGDLDARVHTRLAIWIKSEPNVHQNALLVVEVGPDLVPLSTPYRLNFKPRERVNGGSVVSIEPGRLQVEFPRELLRGYGPTVSWWALASLGLDEGPADEVGDDLDVFSPEMSRFDIASWFD